MRRTKIVATIGPASIDRVKALIRAGMDVARINFSHGSDADHVAAFQAIRQSSDEEGKPIGILADLPGPKVRLGEIASGQVALDPGQRFLLHSEQLIGDQTRASTDHPGLTEDLRPGDRILLADGAVELRVERVAEEVTTEVVKGGTVRSRAGVNIPAERLSVPAITPEDVVSLERAVELGADFVAQSFVRSAEDVRAMRKLIGDRPLGLIVKLETRMAIDDTDGILDEADAVILARGDLGVEIPYEEVPVVQKEILRKAGEAGVASVVATQMLESMVHSPRPTRAEASDVANAVLDGADAILLSAETAIGEFPIETVEAAGRIFEVAETKGTGHLWDRRQPPPRSDAEAIAQAAAALSHKDANVGAIACFTRTGRTAGLLSAVRPRVSVYAFSPDEAVLRALSIRRALIPVRCDYPANTDELIASMDAHLIDGLLPGGTVVLMVASTPVGKAHTNLLKVHRVGAPR